MNILTDKRCSKCGEWKSKSQFYRNIKENRLRSWCKACCAEHAKEWERSNSDKRNDRKRRYGLSQKAHETDRRWKDNNPDKVKSQRRKWNAKNPSKNAEYRNKRRARKLNNGGRFTAKEWEHLKDKYNHICLRCKKREPEIKLTPDHVTPLVTGGSNGIENIQPLCFSCNSTKGAKYIDYR